MELDNKLVDKIIGKLERYSTALEQVIKSREGNFMSRKAVKIEYKQNEEIIKILKEK